jgi:A/G-specific adenine glycosylase
MKDKSTIISFQEAVWTYYRRHGRHDMLWRLPEPNGEFDPYKIMVSEIMLQQTQVSRVAPKFQAFISQFPTVQALAKAQLGDVLKAWSGLGYNRRAKFLWQAAGMVTHEYNGVFPGEQHELTNLPGVGKNTAGAIAAYSFNKPVVFIETNIRTVFIHHFYKNEIGIPDKAILELAEQTLDKQNSREWYWALMDYGAFLKLTVGNVGQASKSYTKQSKFEGSKRQLRGQVLRLLAERPYAQKELAELITDVRLGDVLDELVKEQMITKGTGKYSL